MKTCPRCSYDVRPEGCGLKCDNCGWQSGPIPIKEVMPNAEVHRPPGVHIVPQETSKSDSAGLQEYRCPKCGELYRQPCGFSRICACGVDVCITKDDEPFSDKEEWKHFGQIAREARIRAGQPDVHAGVPNWRESDWQEVAEEIASHVRREVQTELEDADTKCRDLVEKWRKEAQCALRLAILARKAIESLQKEKLK